MKLFSVIIPVYNIADYLPQCIDSVLAQDFQDYEIILVDDGSTDGSSEICDKYVLEYEQIKVIHKENTGPSDARNIGIKNAIGDYIIFLDGDDFWQGNTIFFDLSKIIREENHPDLIVYGFTLFYTDNDDRLGVFYPNMENSSKIFRQDLKELVEKFVFHASICSKVLKRKLLIDNSLFFPEGKSVEDVAWAADMIPYIGRYAIYNSAFYYYRKNRKGSATYKPKREAIFDMIDILAEREENLLSIEGGREYFAYNYFIYLPFVNMLEKKERKYCLDKLKKWKYVLKYYPKNIFGWKFKLKILLYRLLGINISGKLDYYRLKLLRKI
ncbi:Glycosyltransferase involved in cell wall bisynthesis [Capnocytophaga haemolytica]|jgi:glycosyltransferase|uniref:PGL/p-HBAD biosynthesis glycosyltransferase Rv2957/MT3031 n=1 Tax=Capnocytophaga haemolytica TaxID=45243 RepID=A0AAX2GVE5_9FLAO|nr:glycosyltransferase family 2 protein [Capnocytophaga haemolytica]AMD85183.1 hypothetical protein AXF12_06465 [Capnocytophaga haemolytica]SFN65399.1 Glycosyltransferase involved in cell wall bisynthesis [Capnocytophaga haemolytica]SNV04404.1 PGL/p-HBAD biosynthesis glycosyltransferase Rv2957/MT3031 [Capnocytophaga haemolytica]